MLKLCSAVLFFVLVLINNVASDDSDFNDVENDGSFQFGLSNSDFGSHTHSAFGNVLGVVRGRYASRNPANGRIEETEYTAGPRGFRARGPQIHRKMDLSQIPRGPIGSPDDPLADPFDDPSYSFKFTSSDHSRSENSDSQGRVRGLYSYLDDIGERHTVRYAAGKNTGFEVFNAVPDSVANVRYSTPLYKPTNRGARGHMAVERGPPGQYRFISAGPDQRRSESIGSDGVTRGSYSYLDDKGVQRTVQYEAGAGIGYRVVKTIVGPLTHNLPAPFVPTLGLRAPLDNDIGDVAREKIDNEGLFLAAPSGRPFGNRDNSLSRNPTAATIADNSADGGGAGSGNIRDGATNGRRRNPVRRRRPGNRSGAANRPSRTRTNFVEPNSNFLPGNDGASNSESNNNTPNRNLNSDDISEPKGPSVTTDSNEGFNTDYPEVSYDRKKLKDEREKDWQKDGKDSTLITNVGDDYVGLPPGAVVRAHVQSIDLLPLGERAPSPAEAFQRESEDYY